MQTDLPWKQRRQVKDDSNRLTAKCQV